MPKDNFYETAIKCLDEAQVSLVNKAGSDDPIYLLARGLHLMAQGLLQESREVERRLISIEGQMPRP